MKKITYFLFFLSTCFVTPLWAQDDADGVDASVDLDADNDGIYNRDEATCGTADFTRSGNYVIGTTYSAVNLDTTATMDRRFIDFEAEPQGGSTFKNWQVDTIFGDDMTEGLLITNDRIHTVASGNFSDVTLNFDSVVSNVTFNIGDIDEEEIVIVSAMNGATPVTLDATNFSVYNAGNVGYTDVGVLTSLADVDNSYSSNAHSVLVQIEVEVTSISFRISSTENPSGVLVDIFVNDFSYCTARDFDNDGLADHLDLDSDNDGCFDVLEAGFMDQNGDGIIGDLPTTVDANGIVTGTDSIDGYTTPIPDFIDSTVTLACVDTDGDGVNDVVDLDDDNDGILDSDEMEPCGNIDDLGFEGSIASPATGYDSFTADFPVTSAWSNSQGTAGYFTTSSQPPGINNPLPADEGEGYAVFHSGGTFAQEVFTNELANPLTADTRYNFAFSAYQIDATVIFTNPGQLKLFGIRSGTSPVLNGVTQATIATVEAIPEVDLLATTELIDNTVDWETYTVSFYTEHDYDRILLAIDGFDAFLSIDYIRMLCDVSSDGDGIPNRLDLDSDNDGVADVIEVGGSDPDNDGMIGTGIITDTDGDGLSDLADLDNGGSILANLDSDNDSIPNTSDLDSDNDGITDIVEAGGIDSDGDGEVDYPVAGDPSSMTDADGDGLTDDPVVDTDGDDVADQPIDVDVVGGAAMPNPDTDGDGLMNAFDIDSDNDGIIDNIEAQSTTAYVAPTGSDADLDGIDDAYDLNLPLIVNDHDFDGTPDYLDDDSDNDGENDLIEGNDLDGDGNVTPLTGNDSDGDGLDDAYDVDGTSSTNAGGASNGNQVPGDLADFDNPAVGDLDFRERDLDSDGIVDQIDIDDDNDGILDIHEDLNLDGDNDPTTNPTDTDGDGVYDLYDLDSDNDGITDIVEAGGVDSDGDGQVDYPTTGDPSSMTDADNDGLTDDFVVDTNDDGIADQPIDTDVTGGANIPARDEDLDGVRDFQDIDSDNDGIVDLVEAGGVDANGDGRVDYPTAGDPSSMTDADGDGLTDDAVVDTDNDGMADQAIDVDVTGGMAIPNPDTDGDGFLNVYDLDSDGDGIADIVEAGGIDSNNDGEVDYPTAGDPTSMLDADGDGLTDEAVVDTNNDGMADQAIDVDVAGGAAIPTPDSDSDNSPDYIDLDSDDDGISDEVEGTTDTDGDGTPDYLDLDSDDDGITDAEENDPNGDGSGPDDTDGDGTPNYIDLDSDGDGIADADEYDSDGDGSGPDDTDGDGTPDYLDLDSDGDGIADADEYDSDGDGSGPDDTDSDGIPDYLDIDSDGDGIADADEYDSNGDGSGPDDTDGDGTPDYLDLDSDGDSVTDADEYDPNGDGSGPDDTDGDGIADYIDTDDDNDGILTADESDDLNNDGNYDDCNRNGIPDYLDATDCILPLSLPKGFSPNQDGVNDTYVIEGLEDFPEHKLMIMNRWGDKVFEAAPYNNDWNGLNEFGVSFGDELPVGTYYGILDLGERAEDKSVREEGRIVKFWIELTR